MARPRIAADAAAMRVLPGPQGLTRAQLEAIYDTYLDDADEVDDEAVSSTQRDADWRAWCAEQVAAGSPFAIDAAVSAAAREYWQAQHAAAAERGRADRDALGSERTAGDDLVTARWSFTDWLAGIDDATREQVRVAASERAVIRQAREQQEQVVVLQAAVGASQVAQLKVLAAMAPLYRGTANPHLLDTSGSTGSGPAVGVLGQARVRDLVRQVSLALGWTEHTTTRRIALAERMIAVLTSSMARWEAGQIDLAKAMVVAERTEFTSATVAAQVDEKVFGPDGSGVGLTTAALRGEVDRQLALLDAAAIRRRSRTKAARRGTRVRMLSDGMARVEVTGPAPALIAAHERLSVVAQANRAEARAAAKAGRVAADGGDPYAVPGVDVADPSRVGDTTALLADERTVGAHRFDAAVTAWWGAGPADGRTCEAPPSEIHISLPGLVGESDDPGFIEGYGWVAAWLVRQGLDWGRSRVRRVLTDPFTGALITVDGHTYPSSWFTERGQGRGGGGGAPGGTDPGSPGGDPGRGLPIQQLQPQPSEHDVLGPPLPPVSDLVPDLPQGELTEEALATLAAALERAAAAVGVEPWVDPCQAGTCVPVDPADCPARDSTGRALGLHDPPAVLERYVRRRWAGCSGPGSTVRASRCDVDHVHPWRRDGTGGTTCSCNLDPKSRSWHRVKHATDPVTHLNPADPTDARVVAWSARWQHWRCENGSAHWRSPLGTEGFTRPRLAAQPVGRFEPMTWPSTSPRDPRREVVDLEDRRGGLPVLVYPAEPADTDDPFPDDPDL